MDRLLVTARLAIPLSELRLQFSRSGGPGGQNVNKVSTRVDVLFDVRRSNALSQSEKARILHSLAGKIDSGGLLRVQSQESRSQWKNRELALQKLAELVRRALHTRRKRVPTGVPKGARAERFNAKRRKSEKKQGRKAVRGDE